MKQRAISNVHSKILQKLRSNAKVSGRLCSLTLDEFRLWYESQKKVCHYCSLPEERIGITGLNRFTIDRKDNDVGYVRENICLACWICNKIKSNVFTESEFREIAQKYVRPRWNKT